MTQSRTREGSRLLLVEDDLSYGNMLREMLRHAWPDDLVLTHVERLSAATRVLSAQGAGCVLLAATLPDAPGIAALDVIRANTPEVPVVMLVDDLDENFTHEALSRGAQDILIRSRIDSDALRRAVCHAIERQQHDAFIAHKALHDSLTGLPNRALLMDRLAVALDRARRTMAPIAVMFIDVDGFKEINDRYGHAAGDRVLILLGERLRAMLRPMDTVGRFGGDEFALLFEDAGGEREVVLIAERITRAAALPIMMDDGDVSVTVSIGIAMVRDPAVAPEALLHEADEAMYRAKELGPSHYELYDEASRRRASERLEIEARLRRALDRGELTVHYQPRTNLESPPQIVGFEALVRWEDPARGLLHPSDFMTIAEETGLIVPIGEFVIDHALHHLARWQEAQPELTISVNLSDRQLADAGLVAMVTRAIRSSGADPESLCLEIAEPDWSGPTDGALHALEALDALGVTFAIDDYGTRASSIPHLGRLPLDQLKIHESLLAGLGNGDGAGTVVDAVVQLAHALGLTAVAEGIETSAQLEQLRRLGCDEAQGYLLGRPVPEAEADRFVAPAV